jgi:hypothetical protein
MKAVGKDDSSRIILKLPYSDSPIEKFLSCPGSPAEEMRSSAQSGVRESKEVGHGG